MQEVGTSTQPGMALFSSINSTLSVSIRRREKGWTKSQLSPNVVEIREKD